MTTDNSDDSGRRLWYPFHPRAKFFFRGVGVIYIVGVILFLLMEGRFSIIGCLLAAMFLTWETELAPPSLKNRFGIVFHWFTGLFFLGLALISIWFLFFPMGPS